MHGRRQLRQVGPGYRFTRAGTLTIMDGATVVTAKGVLGCRSACGSREQVASVLVLPANPEDGALRADPDCAVRADGLCRNRRPVSGDCEGTGLPASRSLAADPTEHCGLLLPSEGGR